MHPLLVTQLGDLHAVDPGFDHWPLGDDAVEIPSAIAIVLTRIPVSGEGSSTASPYL